MRVLSAMQPSGALHLGNYFGSIQPNVARAASAEKSYYFIVDLHALTTVQDAAALKAYRYDAALDYLACGVNPEKSVMFFQSDVPAHTQLLWVLLTLTPMGMLERAVSYKDKVEKGIAATAGLFTYPVLMAADILLYNVDVVPVGKDQKQHVEMARDIAIKFNNAYGETFTVPEPVIQENIAVVPGTNGEKMSKSYGNTIPLFGDEKAIKKAIMGIVTDSKGPSEPKDPESTTVYRIHSLFLDASEQRALADEYRNGISYGDAKKKLFDAYMDHFAPMRARREALERTPSLVAEVLVNGARQAAADAAVTLERVYKAVGLK